MGLAVAHQLARQGRKVEVLSRRRTEAAGFVAGGVGVFGADLAAHAQTGAADQHLADSQQQLLGRNSPDHAQVEGVMLPWLVHSLQAGHQ